MDTDSLPEPSPRSTIIAFGVVALAIAAGIIALLVTQPQPVTITVVPPEPTATPEPSATPAPITVYVTGAVAQSESLVELPYNSRVEDAIEAAGGALETADLVSVNLADILRDGDQVHVREQAATADPDPLEEEIILATPSSGDIVNINTATVEELDALPGIGPAIAQRIVDHRETNGAFTSIDELDDVSGIGESILNQIREQIVID